MIVLEAGSKKKFIKFDKVETSVSSISRTKLEGFKRLNGTMAMRDPVKNINMLGKLMQVIFFGDIGLKVLKQIQFLEGRVANAYKMVEKSISTPASPLKNSEGWRTFASPSPISTDRLPFLLGLGSG